MRAPGRSLHGIWLGRRRYAPVLELQQRLVSARSEGAIPDTLLLLEHEPVVTLGRGAKAENVLLHEDALRARGWDRVETNRGGDVTLHAPGQLVGYPIVDLKPDRCDVRRYVKDLAETMRLVAATYGVSSGELPGLVGLWADEDRTDRFEAANPPLRAAKLGAIGVHVSRWVTSHGFALNLSTSPDLFSVIVPCGIRDHGVTSIRALTGHGPPVREAAEVALGALGSVLSASVMGLTDMEGGPLDPPLPHRAVIGLGS